MLFQITQTSKYINEKPDMEGLQEIVIKYLKDGTQVILMINPSIMMKMLT